MEKRLMAALIALTVLFSSSIAVHGEPLQGPPPICIGEPYSCVVVIEDCDYYPEP